MQRFNEGQDAVALASQLSAWFRRAGVQHTELAVDVADLLYAARKVEGAVQELLRLDLTERDHVERAVDELGNMHAWLFTEIKPHLEDLEAGWSSIENPIASSIPDEQ